MNRIPITRYRPTQASDGEGGFVPTFGEDYPCYGSLTLHDNVLSIIIDRCEDVKIEDVLVVADEMDGDDAFYRVLTISQPPRGRNRVLSVERIDRPVWPLAVDYLFFEDDDQLFFEGEPLSFA